MQENVYLYNCDVAKCGVRDFCADMSQNGDIVSLSLCLKMPIRPKFDLNVVAMATIHRIEFYGPGNFVQGILCIFHVKF